MKKCSGCERTFADEKLSFCTACGGALVVDTGEEEPLLDPFKTMVATPAPPREEPVVSPAGPLEPLPEPEPVVNPSWDQIGGQVDQPAPGQEPSRNLAMGSMICGIVSIICGLAILGPVAMILGFIAMKKEKEDPQRYGGRTFALVGIGTGVLGTLICLGLVIGAIFYLLVGTR